MRNVSKDSGVVVPMITPMTADGKLDLLSTNRVLEFLIAAGVNGIFIMGTTGEGNSIPNNLRQELVEQTIAQCKGRVKIYAGIGDAYPVEKEIEAANKFFRSGVDVIVSRPPLQSTPPEIRQWYKLLLEGINGPLILYNMPLISKVSIPLDVVGELLGHPRLAGIKDSENNEARLKELMQRFGGRPDFSILIGVGGLMEEGLRLGADGIVPSVGNLIPDICCDFIFAAYRSDWTAVKDAFAKMNNVTAVYQKGRALNESLSTLKAAMHCRGLCLPCVLPPLRNLSDGEIEKIRQHMVQLNLTNGA